MRDENAGLYWVSGWAGTGKSCLVRFLDDDARTKLAFQEWAEKRNTKLVLATFYFWNSEAANDDCLKSLIGLYRGILYSLINQCSEFAELLFPHHFVDGRPFEESFPTTPDMDLAFETLIKADHLPAAVGLIIDGLDEYDAENRQQMAMANTLRRAGQSPHLKVLVSSRPESAFEAIFRDSAKLRLHELTEQDRKAYTSDRLTAVPRFGSIATPEERLRLVDLITGRSEGIFLWVYLVVETVAQEIDISLDIVKLEKVVENIPSGNKELSQVFDHMLRNRIPQEHRILRYRLIQTLHYSYTIADTMIPWIKVPKHKHMITAVLLSFFEDDINSVLDFPIGPLAISKTVSRIGMTINLIRKACAGLLDARHAKPGELDLGYSDSDDSEADPPIHFLHKDVAIYLNQRDTTHFLQRSLVDVKINLHTNLLKCFVAMMKLYNPYTSPGEQLLLTHSDYWDIWRLVEGSMRIARGAEEGGDSRDLVVLLDAMDNVMAQHYSGGRLRRAPFAREPIDQVFIKPEKGSHWVSQFPVDRLYGDSLPSGLNRNQLACSQFVSFSIEQGLVRYVESKLHKDGKDAIPQVGIPALFSGCGNPRIWYLVKDSIRSETVNLLLDYGTDPNEEFQGITCWQNALWTARYFRHQTADSFYQLAEVLRLLLSAGADPNAGIELGTGRRIHKGHWETKKRVRSAAEHIETTFVRGEALCPTEGRFELPWFQDNLTRDEVARIADLGHGLLDLLEEKRAALPEEKKSDKSEEEKADSSQEKKADLSEGKKTDPPQEKKADLCEERKADVPKEQEPATDTTETQRSKANWRTSLSRKTVVFKACCYLLVRRKGDGTSGQST